MRVPGGSAPGTPVHLAEFTRHLINAGLGEVGKAGWPLGPRLIGRFPCKEPEVGRRIFDNLVIYIVRVASEIRSDLFDSNHVFCRGCVEVELLKDLFGSPLLFRLQESIERYSTRRIMFVFGERALACGLSI